MHSCEARSPCKRQGWNWTGARLLASGDQSVSLAAEQPGFFEVDLALDVGQEGELVHREARTGQWRHSFGNRVGSCRTLLARGLCENERARRGVEKKAVNCESLANKPWSVQP